MNARASTRLSWVSVCKINMAAFVWARRLNQSSFLGCFLSNLSFVSQSRSFFRLGLYAGDLKSRKQGLLRRDFSTEEQSDVDRRVMITLKREETEGQALSELHEKDLLDYFSSYGKIQHVNWIRDRATNAVKGYGFVTFYDTDSFKEAVKRKRHMLGGRQVNVFPATEREKNSSIQKRKIVVKRHRGWKGEMDLTRIQDYFSKFGEIEKVDAKNLQTKGYMHITFKNEESVESILLDNQHDIDGEIMFVLRTHSSDQQWNQWRLEKELIQKLKILKIKEGLQVNEKMGTHVTVVIPKKFKHCISEESLEEHFSSYGEIEKAFILRNEVTMESKGCGMVTFKDSHVVEEILAAGKHKIDDVEIFVKKSLIDDE